MYSVYNAQVMKMMKDQEITKENISMLDQTAGATRLGKNPTDNDTSS